MRSQSGGDCPRQRRKRSNAFAVLPIHYCADGGLQVTGSVGMATERLPCPKSLAIPVIMKTANARLKSRFSSAQIRMFLGRAVLSTCRGHGDFVATSTHRPPSKHVACSVQTLKQL